MAFASDTMTDTVGTLLTSHTGEVGATWTAGGASSPGKITDANRVRCDGGGTGYGWHVASGSPAGVEYTVAVDVRVVDGSSSVAGVVGRAKASGGGETCYLAIHRIGSTRWELQKAVSGTYTSLGTFSQVLATNNTYALTLDITDAAKRLLVDGVERINSGDNAITTADKAGVWLETAVTNTTGMHLDNFVASDAAAGGPIPKRTVNINQAVMTAVY